MGYGRGWPHPVTGVEAEALLASQLPSGPSPNQGRKWWVFPGILIKWTKILLLTKTSGVCVWGWAAGGAWYQAFFIHSFIHAFTHSHVCPWYPFWPTLNPSVSRAVGPSPLPWQPLPKPLSSCHTDLPVVSPRGLWTFAFAAFKLFFFHLEYPALGVRMTSNS